MLTELDALAVPDPDDEYVGLMEPLKDVEEEVVVLEDTVGHTVALLDVDDVILEDGEKSIRIDEALAEILAVMLDDVVVELLAVIVSVSLLPKFLDKM
jgi:hypothetical protein